MMLWGKCRGLEANPSLSCRITEIRESPTKDSISSINMMVGRGGFGESIQEAHHARLTTDPIFCEKVLKIVDTSGILAEFNIRSMYSTRGKQTHH